MDKLKVGLIGLGSMGQNHLRVLSMLKTVDIRFVYDIDAERAITLARKYGAPVTVNLEQDVKNIDALVIASPTNTHHCYILSAIDNDIKNVFVEKPLTDNIRCCEELAALLTEKGMHLQVGYIERFNPAVVELKKILQKSAKVINIDFTRTNKVSSRITDVDVILDLMIHDIDLALYLNGPVKHVNAYGSIEHNMIVFACAVLTHENGCFSHITASRITEKKIRSISATCSDMYVDCDLLKKEVFINKQTSMHTYDNVKLVSIEETVGISTEEALLSELLKFIHNSLGNLHNEGTPGLEAALSSMHIANEIQNKIWSKSNATNN